MGEVLEQMWEIVGGGGGGGENQEGGGRRGLGRGSKYEALKMDIWNFQNSWIWIVITLACKFYGEFISGIFFSHEILDFMYF